MVAVAKEIACSHCGAPLPVQPGEILATCNYCGFTSVIETGSAFEFEHSLITNTIGVDSLFELVKSWMGKSFLGPKDLPKRAAPAEQNLVYLPLWVVSADATTHYKGILERISPPSEREGDLENRYDWLVLARRKTDFPIRAYHLSLEGKIPFDFTKIDRNAKVLNAEMDAQEAIAQAKDEVENLHEYLAKEKIDRIVEIKTQFDVSGTNYLHAPVWFVVYTYRNGRYQVLVDGSSAEVIKGDLPAEDFKLI